MPEKHNRRNPQAPLDEKNTLKQVNFEARTTVSVMVLVMFITAVHALRTILRQEPPPVALFW